MKESKEWLQDKLQKQEQKVLKYHKGEKELWILEDIYSTYLNGLKYKELRNSLDNNDNIRTYIGWNDVEIKKMGKINE